MRGGELRREELKTARFKRKSAESRIRKGKGEKKESSEDDPEMQ